MRLTKLLQLIAAMTVTIVSLQSCTDNRKTNNASNERITVELTPDPEAEIKLSDYFLPEYETIILKGNLIGWIKSVAKTDSLIIVEGNGENGLLHTFDKDGNYIRPLLQKGQGPDEVKGLSTIKIRYNKVFALVNYGNELWSIDPYSGKVEDKLQIPDIALYPEDFAFIGNDIVFYKHNTNLALPDEQHNLYVYDPTLDSIKARYGSIDAEACEYISFSRNGSIDNLDDTTVYFMNAFQQGVDQLDINGLHRKVEFAENAFTFPDAKLHGPNTFMGFIEYCKSCDYIWGHVEIFPTGNLILSRFIHKENPYFNIIDLNANKSQSALKMHDDIVTGSTFDLSKDSWGNIAGTTDREVYFIYPAELLVNENMESAKTTSPFSGMSAEDNDAIIILRER